MLVTGIARGTRSGKTTFAKKIIGNLPSGTANQTICRYFCTSWKNNLMVINILTNFTQQNLK